ncbi:MAG: NTP transferase domain-containing protein [Rhizomicrobium sp.]
MSRIAGVILAGGAGTRIGGDKALVPFGAGTLLDAAIARVESQVSALALSVPRADAAAYRARFAGPLLFDAAAERAGPLAGIVAGLEWLGTLDDTGWLATFPCDTPFLPRDLVAQLSAGAGRAPVAARDGSRLHGVCALWPLDCLSQLREGVTRGTLRSVRGALDALGGTARDIAGDADAFFNVNTKDDLAKAEQIAARAP